MISFLSFVNVKFRLSYLNAYMWLRACLPDCPALGTNTNNRLIFVTFGFVNGFFSAQSDFRNNDTYASILFSKSAMRSLIDVNELNPTLIEGKTRSMLC